MTNDEAGLIPAPTNATEAKKYNISTGKEWAARNPDKAAIAIALRVGQGWPMIRVAEHLEASPKTINAYIDSLGLLDVPKAEIARKARRAAMEHIDRLADDPDATPPAQRAIAAKLMMDTAALAEGQVAQIVEHRHRIELKPASREDLEAFKARLRSRQESPVIEAEIAE